MDQFALTAVMAIISIMKHQLAALETLLTTLANVKKNQSQTQTVIKHSTPTDAHMSDDEERMFQEALERARLEELARMGQAGENYFVQTMQGVADGSGDQSQA